MSYNKVVLVGVSEGNLGRLTLSAFVNSTLEVSAVVRLEPKAVFQDTINVIRTDFTPKSLAKVFKGKNAIIGMLPMVGLADQIVIPEATITAGGLPLGLWGLNLANRTALLIDGGSVPFTTSNARQMNRAMVAVLAHLDETTNKLVLVESFTTTQLEMLQAAEKATGTKWPASHLSTDELRAEGCKPTGEGNVEVGGGKVIGAAVFGKTALEDHTYLGSAEWSVLLELAKENVEETMAYGIN
ncbi:isoflavone reductase [Seiridium cupressi]